MVKAPNRNASQPSQLQLLVSWWVRSRRHSRSAHSSSTFARTSQSQWPPDSRSQARIRLASRPRWQETPPTVGGCGAVFEGALQCVLRSRSESAVNGHRLCAATRASRLHRLDSVNRIAVVPPTIETADQQLLNAEPKLDHVQRTFGRGGCGHLGASCPRGRRLSMGIPHGNGFFVVSPMASASSKARCARGLRAGKLLLQHVDNPLRGRENPESCKSPSVEHQRTVDEHLELAVGSTDDFNVRIQLPFHARRHTDGMQARDSIGAGTDLDARHVALCSSLGGARGRADQRVRGET